MPEAGIDDRLAVEGGTPIRLETLPYGRHSITEQDVQAVVGVLRSDWLTTGPTVGQFEREFANLVGASEAVALSSGTAALHAAMHALRVGKGDEVIVPTLTFAATANCVVYQGATPRFVDVDPGTLLVDPARVEEVVNSRTKAILAVDYAGQPCDYEALREVAEPLGIPVVADACHALGAELDGTPVGGLADLSCFSLHPVKHVTTGEGGAVTTDKPELARRMREFRNHGITVDHRERADRGTWEYDIGELGYNYRLTDFQCALGSSQLSRLPEFVERRREIAAFYDEHLIDLPCVPLVHREGVTHSYHLYVVQLDLARLEVDRGGIFEALRAEGIGVNVHYIPVHLHPFYRTHYGTALGDFPVSESAYERILSLPIFPTMSRDDSQDVVKALYKVFRRYAR